MRVHNVYSDLLLGLSRFINNRVLHGRPIEHFQLNIGDSGLQLDYEPGYSLPACIINLENIRPYNNHPYIFQHRSGNKHNIPVLYNNDKEITLWIQEEQFELNVNLLINCSNHMQALDIQHQLLSYLPVQKYMHFYEFFCFLEADDFLINKWLFDINNDTIDNLFIKQNKYTDTVDYSFGLKIQPLLRFNDITIQMSPDTNQETFQVSTSIEYLMTIPVYLHYPNFNIHAELGPETINVTRENVYVPASLRDYGRITLSSVEPNDNYFKTIDVPIYFEPNNNPTFEFRSTFNFIGMSNEQVTGELVGNFFGEFTEFDFETIIDNKVLMGSGEFFHNFAMNEITGELKGYAINGNMSEIRVDDNDNLICWFEGTINNRSIGKEVILQYTVKNKFRELKNIRTIFKNSSYILIENKRIFSRNIYNSVENIAKLTTTIVPSSTSVAGIVLRNKQLPHNEIEFMFPEGLSTLRNDGIINTVFSIPDIDSSNQYQENYLNKFIFKVPYGVVLYDFLPEGNYELTIQIDTRDGTIGLVKFEDRDNSGVELDYDIDKLIFDKINFELITGISPRYIDRINMDFNWSEGAMITDSLPESVGTYNKYNQTIVLSKLNDLNKIEYDHGKNAKWQFAVNIKGVPNLPGDLNNLTWKMIYPDGLLTTTSDKQEVKLDIDLSDSDKLIFEISNLWYYEYFKNINKTSLLFLSLGKKQK
jgi:hypothetical protein